MLGKQNKTKQNPKPPSSLCCLRPSNSGRLPALNFIYHLRPYVEILITDIFIFISQTEKACLSSKPFLLKRLELTPSAAGRMVTSEKEWEGGKVWCFGKEKVGASPNSSWALLRGACITHGLHYLSPPKTFKSLWLTPSAHALASKHSSLCCSLST